MKLFLSSTYTDLKPERDAVEQVIVALGQHFVGMEYFFAREETTRGSRSARSLIT